MSNLINGFVDLRNSWNDIKSRHKYSLYAIVLCTSSDITMRDYIDKYWDDLDRLSDNDCLIFVFDQKHAIKKPDNNVFYDMMAIPTLREEGYIVAREMGIKYNDLPCIVFFKELCSKEFVILPLRSLDKDPQNIIREMRALFDIIRFSSDLSAIKKFMRKMKLKCTIRMAKKGILSILKEIVGKIPLP